MPNEKAQHTDQHKTLAKEIKTIKMKLNIFALGIGSFVAGTCVQTAFISGDGRITILLLSLALVNILGAIMNGILIAKDRSRTNELLGNLKKQLAIHKKLADE